MGLRESRTCIAPSERIMFWIAGATMLGWRVGTVTGLVAKSESKSKSSESSRTAVCARGQAVACACVAARRLFARLTWNLF